MRLTIFFNNKSTQVINLSEHFLLDSKGKKETLMTLHKKASDVAFDIAQGHYYDHHLELN